MSAKRPRPRPREYGAIGRELAPRLPGYIEVWCLTDREIARLHHCGVSTVNHYRNRTHLPVAQSWRRRFERKYHHKGGELKLIALVHAGATGTELARYFGFTRQWGHELRKKVLAQLAQTAPASVSPDAARR